MSITKDKAQELINLIDLTSLNNNDDNATILTLSNKSITPFGEVAAICIYSHFIQYAKQVYNELNKNIKIATVVNFPHAMIDEELIKYELDLAISRGADEIDLVYPYHALIKGNSDIGARIVTIARDKCKTIKLKVILETGELKQDELIYLASKIAINAGCDFIKTSTGKVSVNATPNAVKVMLEAIKDSQTNCGIKIAGGVKTVADAMEYYNLVQSYMGHNWINNSKFRFGTSSLLDNIINYLEDKQQIITNKY
jgi:deoxyribose-phosphate aldolase